MTGGWPRILVLASLLALAGCSEGLAELPASPVPPAPDEGQALPPERGDSTAPDAGPTPPADGGVDSQEESPIIVTPDDEVLPPIPDGEEPPSLPPSACVPSVPLPPESEPRACVVTVSTSTETQRREYDAAGTLRDERLLRANGVLTQHRQYDADSHLLEYRMWEFDGTPFYAEKSVWEDGLQRSYEREKLSFYWPLNWTWTYDAERRVTERRDGPSSSHVYVYEDGRLARIDHQSRGTTKNSTEYHYDAAGRLLHISAPYQETGCDRDLLRCESYSYDSTGRLREFNWTSGYNSSDYTETYDVRGRVLTTSDVSFDDGVDMREHYSAREYDAAGRVSVLERGLSSFPGSSHERTRYLYGGSGRLLLEWSVRKSHSRNEPEESTTRNTTRYTYLCGSSRLHLKEVDTNGDGTVDSRCTYTWDTAGRPRLEQCESLSDPGAPPTRRETHYDCAAP